MPSFIDRIRNLFHGSTRSRLAFWDVLESFGRTSVLSEEDQYWQSSEEERSTPFEYVDAQCSLPSLLHDEGVYAIQFTRSEMYDLGNIAFITHFLLYSRGDKIVVDVTSEINSAPLLSRTQPAELYPPKGVELIEKYLTGEVQPQFDSAHGHGVKCFIATEIYRDGLREKMQTLQRVRTTLDVAVQELHAEISALKKSYPDADNEDLNSH